MKEIKKKKHIPRDIEFQDIPPESKGWIRYFDSFNALKAHFGKSNYTI